MEALAVRTYLAVGIEDLVAQVPNPEFTVTATLPTLLFLSVTEIVHAPELTGVTVKVATLTPVIGSKTPAVVVGRTVQSAVLELTA
ncbi:MAG: hypothetical protein NVS2B17_15560 [Candidatus Velthaea sp.]